MYYIRRLHIRRLHVSYTQGTLARRSRPRMTVILSSPGDAPSPLPSWEHSYDQSRPGLTHKISHGLPGHTHCRPGNTHIISHVLDTHIQSVTGVGNSQVVSHGLPGYLQTLSRVLDTHIKSVTGVGHPHKARSRASCTHSKPQSRPGRKQTLSNVLESPTNLESRASWTHEKTQVAGFLKTHKDSITGVLDTLKDTVAGVPVLRFRVQGVWCMVEGVGFGAQGRRLSWHVSGPANTPRA